MYNHVVAIEDSVGVEVRIFDDKGEAVNYADILGGYYFLYKDKTEIILEDLDYRRREAIKKAVDKYENSKERNITIRWDDL